MKGRILNVNDREVPRYVNEQMLAKGGFDVVSVVSGEDALGAVRENIDLVLLDIMLPGADGYEVCRRIKADPATSNVAVLMSSATFTTTSNKVSGLDAGADGYLAQPFEHQELIATIRALLRTRAAERRSSALAVELQRTMDVRDEFLAMLGHELRNPIGAITTALHLLHEAHDEAALKRYLPILDRQAKGLGRIVDDLLDVARVTRGKISLTRQVVDLREIVERCRDAIGAEVLGAKHRVSIEISGNAVLVDGDIVRLEQIIMNLLTNAVKYTPQEGHVTVRVSASGDRAIVEVRDDGIGMDAATLARVFDTFVQAKQGLDRSRGGLGLGLTVVRSLVELHGGTISATSDGEGKGSVFTVDLPLAHADATRTPTPPRLHAVPSLEQLRVLIVEDNEDAREALAELLRTSVREVATESNGASGVDRALVMRPDVMLVDIRLPVLDGYEVAKRMHETADGHRPRLIAMTGYGQPDDRKRALASGFDAHLVKPISYTQLLAQLATAAGISSVP